MSESIIIMPKVEGANLFSLYKQEVKTIFQARNWLNLKSTYL
jgi:hypothetical protein